MQANTISNPNDPMLTPAPTDSIQCLKWAPNPAASLICGAGWDCKATVWEVTSQNTSAGRAQVTNPEPVLSVSWKHDHTNIFLGTGDNSVKLWDLSTNALQTIGSHTAPVKEVAWCEQIGHVISGSWDGTASFWDTRQANPTAQINLPGRVFGMSLQYPMLVAALSDKKIAVWNLQNLHTNPQPEISMDPTLKYQIRSVSLAPSGKHFVLGLLEGRCIVKSIKLENTIKIATDFAFKCHRDSQAHSVNALAFSPIHGTFATGGSDGNIVYWDMTQKQRVKAFQGLGAPVTAIDFKSDSSIVAYALGYDWHKGIEEAGKIQPRVCFRPAFEESKPKTKPSY